MGSHMGIQFFALSNIIVVLAISGLSIYALILFIMLARRGIKALDIYIKEKDNYIK